MFDPKILSQKLAAIQKDRNIAGMTVAVTDDYESRETHIAAALDNLGDALNGNDSVFQAIIFFFFSFILVRSHVLFLS